MFGGVEYRDREMFIGPIFFEGGCSHLDSIIHMNSSCVYDVRIITGINTMVIKGDVLTLDIFFWEIYN